MVNSTKCVIKRIIFIAALVGALAILFTGCGPDRDKDNPDLVFLNETCNIYRDGEHIVTVSYVGYSSEEIDNTTNNQVLVIETITIQPLVPIELNIEDFLLTLGYEVYENDKDKYHTSIEYNIQKNQYDIFENAINEVVTYNFCFVIPKEKNGTLYSQVGASLLVFHSYSLVNGFR